jgi:hypothetical protein
MVNSFV